MTTPTYATDLTDAQWQLIKELLPPPKKRGRPRTTCLRSAFNAMLYLLRSGCRWNLIPRSYPHWRTVYDYFRAWQEDGTWKRLHDTLRAAVRRQCGRHKHPTAGSVDSQSIKSSHSPGSRGFDAGKKVSGRKRHCIVDTQGLLLAVHVTCANISDTAGAVLVLRQLDGSAKKLRLLWCDGGYFKTAIEQAKRQGLEMRPVVPLAGQKGFSLLPRRWVIERTFAWISACRRLARDYETRPQSSEALILMAMTHIMIKRLMPK